MSVNVVAILDHGLDASHVQALPRALHPQAAPQLATATGRLFSLLKPFYPLLSEDDGWHVKPYHAWTISDPETAWAQGGLMEVDGPAGVRVGVGRSLCDVGFYWRWSSFLSDATIRTSVEQVCRELARILGSHEAIYVPDSAYTASGVIDLVLEGASLEEANRWLLGHCGPPALGPDHIISEALGKGYQYDVDPNGYLIDRLVERP